ncbi:GTP-binding protein [Treponema sp.]|uniref:CobW family GTP-binding protein n=1 Tax=Treponema sp. TaxID=166 RepID=UPI0025E22D98|nr:GTP-binding protein [Treponema sp.]MCR5217437.1 GTP-binding protein [Treponema sp.]
MSKKPVTLITGYLGSGKTTLLNEILRQEKRRVALIVNDMGSINIDAAIIKKNGSAVAQSEMYEMQNGCICCTLREEFIKQVEKISENDKIETVFVEASGISDPGAIAASFLAYEDAQPDTNVYLSNIVTVVDADRIYREFMTNLQNYDEKDANNLASNDITTLIVDQIEFCNTIVLNKLDLLNEEQIEQVIKIIRDFQPKAEIIKTTQGQVEIDRITSTQKFNYEMVDSSSAIQKAINSLNQADRGFTDEYGISSFSYEYKKPFDQKKFMTFIKEDFPKELIRAKGYIWFKDRPEDVLLFEQAGRNSSVMAVAYWVAALDEATQKECLADDEDLRNTWDPVYGDRINQIVFIGKNYNKAKIVSRLEECLA